MTIIYRFLNPILYTVNTSYQYGTSYQSLFSYSLLVSNQSTSFYLHPNTGVITLVYPLDRDTDSVIHITLLVTDAGTPALSSSINITLYLTDVNDNTPTFSSDIILIDLMEDIANGSLVHQFEAVDNDEELNGTVRQVVYKFLFSILIFLYPW